MRCRPWTQLCNDATAHRRIRDYDDDDDDDVCDDGFVQYSITFALLCCTLCVDYLFTMPMATSKKSEGADYVPKFCYIGTGSSRTLVLAATPEASSVAAAASRQEIDRPAKSPEMVEREARRACRGEVTEELILANSHLQFGKYREKTFRWLLENDVGYAVGLVRSVEREADSGSRHPLNVNKRKFVDYARLFPAMAAEIRFRELRDAAADRAKSSGDRGDQLLEFGKHRLKSWKDMYESTDREIRTYVDKFIIPKTCMPGSKMALFQQYCIDRRAAEATSTLQSRTKTGHSTAPATVTRPMDSDDSDTDIEDAAILAAVAEFEKEGKCLHYNCHLTEK